MFNVNGNDTDYGDGGDDDDEQEEEGNSRYHWVDGTPLDYLNWADGEPNSADGNLCNNE